LKIFLLRIWRTLLLILKFCKRQVGQPLSNYFKQKSAAVFREYQPKLTLPYLQQKANKIRQYNWRTARLHDFQFLGRGARRLLLVFILGFFLLYLAVYTGLLGSMPSQRALKAKQNNTASEVYSADSVLLGRYYIQDRTNVRYRDISPRAIEALVSTEDARFYQHHGVDAPSLLRVFFKTILFQDESSGGGSTISQQLAKNLYPRRNYLVFSTSINKLREFIISRRLENVYTKPQILELYLNTVPMGGDLFGIERAAQRFFYKSAVALKTEEAAVLIGMLKATTTYNPRLNLEKSRQRRNVVLGQMVKYNYLSRVEADSLKSRPLKLDYHYETHNDGLAPYFREQLRLELVKWCATQKKPDGKVYNLYTDGLKIYTTIHAGMQKQAERAVRRRMARLQSQFNAHWQGRSPWGKNPEVIQSAMRRSDHYKKLKAAGQSEAEIQKIFSQPRAMKLYSWQGTITKTMSPLDSLRYYERFLNTGLLAMEPRTGFIRAWVGGINHQLFKYDHVKAKRQVGSTFKPFVYAAALEKGLEPCRYFPNQRVTYPAYDNWSPRNADEQYGGEYSMAGALAHSVNTVSAQIIMQTGIAPAIAVARRLGIQSDLPPVPALALGTTNLSLFEMVSAYTTFANEGYYVKPVYIERIVDRSGKILRQHPSNTRSRRALAYEHAATMLGLMQQVVEQGSARRLRSEFKLAMDIAGKTGTTQDHADGWFIGMTPDLVTGVWVGAENPAVRFRTLALGQGSNTALPIWGEFMALVTRTSTFSGYRYSRFRPLPPELEARLTCAAYLDNSAPPPVARESFLDRLFDRFRGRGREKKKDEDRWEKRNRQESEKRREREKKRAEENKKRWEDKRKEKGDKKGKDN